MAKIFISHSAKDKPVIDTLSELLIQGCDLRKEDVFSGSIEDAGIMIGSDFVTWIKDRLKDSELIIQFVTPNYIESKLCMAEMGAAWAIDKEIFPFLHPDIDRELSFIFLGKHTTRLNETGLDNLKDFISDHIQKADKNTETWASNKNDFLDTLPGLLKSLPAPEKYTAEEYNKIYKEKEAANNLYKSASKKNDEFQFLIEDLKRSKKSEEAKTTVSKGSPDLDADDKPVKDEPVEKQDVKTDNAKDTESKDSPDLDADDKPVKDEPVIKQDVKTDNAKDTGSKDSPDLDTDDKQIENTSKDKKDDKADQAKETEKKDPPDREAYDTLIKDVTDELSYFDKSVKRCLFAYFSDEDWVPSSNILKWYNADIEKAKRRDYIEKGSTKDSFIINNIHPTISPVIDKIKELDNFLKEKISPELAEYLEKERFITFSIKNKEYWESELMGESLIE
jgi:hypothetical protein